MTKINNDAIGKRIRDARIAKGLTQEQFADIVNKQTNTIKAIEYGERGMSLQTLLDISEVLGISSDFILKGKYPDEDVSETRKTYIDSINTTVQNMTDTELISMDSAFKYSLREMKKIKEQI